VTRARLALAALALVACALVAPAAYAQMGTPSMGGAGQRNNTPTQSGPVQNRSVGPRQGAMQSDDEDNSPQVSQRPTDTMTQAPADPLAIPPEVAARIGTDAEIIPPAPEGSVHRTYFPYYEERKGDYRFRLLPPLYLEYTRGLPTRTPRYGEPTHEDTQSLTALLYYHRRSPYEDVDTIFPLAWRVREGDAHVYVLGPIAHREAPGEHDNWLAPLVFEGERKDGGYFHLPFLLTTTHWSTEKAFTYSLLYFRDRRGDDLDWGVVPFLFRGDNHNLDGARRTYTLIPPLLYFHKETEIDDGKMTVVGPVILRQTAKRQITDIAPLFFHIEGRPEAGGIRESHTTLFPFFHYGWADDEKHETLFAVPGYMRRTTTTTDTMLTPLFSHATTRNGSTSLTAVGPIVPLLWYYRDKDINQTTWAGLPLIYHSQSPRGTDWLTPLFGRFEDYGVSRTYWVLPSFVVSNDVHGWSTDLFPLAFVGRNEKATHAVLAPVFWDFANPKGRTTITFPVYWRFADTTDDSITEVAANTVYIQKRVAGGIEWQFHVVPFVSYGEMPNGHWWNFLFGMAGFTHDTDGSKTVRVFWIPIKVKGADKPRLAAIARGKDPAYHGAKF
jgi:hypothetical protein